MQLEMFIGGIIETEKRKDQGYWPSLMVMFMTDFGLKGWNKDEAGINGQILTYLKVHFLKIFAMDMEFYNLPMESDIKEHGVVMWNRGKVFYIHTWMHNANHSTVILKYAD